MTILTMINWFISIFFFLCYTYQIFYIVVALIKKPKKFETQKLNKYAVLISARNEENVIVHLIDSIKAQDYPSDLIDIHIIADNCTDRTATVSKNAGAIVYERFNKEKVGKGYALDFLFEQIFSIYGKEYYDGYFIFDADNLLEPDYITEMNKVFSSGYKIVTSYRNSKNYEKNWISAGYALWFLREARHLNNPRMILGTSAAVSGTGFMFHRDIINATNGWKYFLLTEDIEFTISNVLKGEKVGYCHTAMLYDEQPETFRQSWTQRLRWAKGYFQVFHKFGVKLLRGVCTKKFFSCYDMTMTIMPALFLTIICFIVNAVMISVAAVTKDPSLPQLLYSLWEMVRNAYGMLFFVGLVTGITEWKNIKCSAPKKILYFFTFPIFMFTYIPISLTALFKKVEWKPIKHTVSVSINEMK